LGQGFGTALGKRLGAPLRERLRAALRERVGAALGQGFRAALGQRLCAALGKRLGTTPGEPVGAALRQGSGPALRDRRLAQIVSRGRHALGLLEQTATAGARCGVIGRRGPAPGQGLLRRRLPPGRPLRVRALLSHADVS
jgi:hypothetical protein